MQCFCNQGSKHCTWYKWPHGILKHVAPFKCCSQQTPQYLPLSPSFSSTLMFGSWWMASAEAGGGPASWSLPASGFSTRLMDWELQTRWSACTKLLIPPSEEESLSRRLEERPIRFVTSTGSTWSGYVMNGLDVKLRRLLGAAVSRSRSSEQMFDLFEEQEIPIVATIMLAARKGSPMKMGNSRREITSMLLILAAGFPSLQRYFDTCMYSWFVPSYLSEISIVCSLSHPPLI